MKGVRAGHEDKQLEYTLLKLTWNPTKLVLSRCLSFSKEGLFSGSMLVFGWCIHVTEKMKKHQPPDSAKDVQDAKDGGRPCLKGFNDP